MARVNEELKTAGGLQRLELETRLSATSGIAEELEIAFEDGKLSQEDYFRAMQAGFQRDLLGCVLHCCT